MYFWGLFRFIMKNNYPMLAKTFFGLEDVLCDELKKLGATNIKKGVRSVWFEGDKGFMYKANLCLRTALKILKPIAEFRIRKESDFYDKIYDMPWQNYLSKDSTFAIAATLQTTVFNHSKYVALRAKDAIADKFRNTLGTRPNVDVLHPDVGIHIHIHQNQVFVSLDSSGVSLHHRGYRSATNIAPINEVLAAGILLLSQWNGQCDFIDPMCGSGTFLVEAAMIACNIPANIHRREFAFEKWNDFDAKLFDLVFESCLKKTQEFSFKIQGFDKAPSAVAKARENIKNANLSEYISVTHKDFFTSKKNNETPVHMVFNPPYGERLPINITSFYKNIGDTLKQNYPNTETWFITSNLEAIKSVGLHPSRKIQLFNGKLESRLLQYRIYQGSKKQKKNTPKDML